MKKLIMIDSNNNTKSNRGNFMRLWQSLFALLVGLTAATHAVADWPFGFGGDSNEAVVDLEVDPFGNVVVLGSFIGVTRFGEQSGGPVVEFASETENGRDIFVAKYGASGQLLWVRQAGGVGDDKPLGLTIDDAGGIYLSGDAADQIRFGKLALPGNGAGAAVGFVAGLSVSGEWLWASRSTVDRAWDIDAELDGGGVYYVENQQLHKHDRDGILEWSLGPATVELGFPRGIESGNNGRIFVSGATFSTSKAVCGTPIAAQMQYVALIQETVIGGVAEVQCQWAVAVADRNTANNNLYGTLATDGTNAYFADRGRLIKLDRSGTVLDFGIQVDQPDLISAEAGASVVVDPQGNVFMAGVYTGVPSITATLADGTGFVAENLPPSDVYNAFVVKVNSNGAFQWITTPDRPDHPSIGPDKINARIALNATGDVQLAGTLLGFADFTIDTTTTRITSVNFPVEASLYFDGNDDYLTLPGEILDGQEHVTIEFQVNMTPGASAPWSVFSAANATYNNEMLILFPDPSNLQVWGPEGVEVTFPLGFEVNRAGWHHFALERLALDDQTIAYWLWVDGVLTQFQFYVCAQNCRTLDVDPQGLIIGQDQDVVGGGFDPGQAFEQRLDDIRIWSGARTSSDITQPLTGTEPGLLAYWTFDNPLSGSTLPDRSPNGNDISLLDVAKNARPERALGVFYPGIDLTHAEVDVRPTDGFLALIDHFNGTWITPQTWVVGESITQPADTHTQPPVITIEGFSGDPYQSYFYWSVADEKLYATGVPPGAVSIDWKKYSDPNDTETVPTFGVSIYPPQSSIQYHIAGAPVLLEPAFDPAFPAQPMRFGEVYSPASAAGLKTTNAVLGPVFNQELEADGSTPGEVVLLYYKTGDADVIGNGNDHSPYFVTVQTVAWNDERVNQTSDRDVLHDIGQRIDDIRHQDPSGLNGHIVFEKGPYDGVGADKAYDRDSRSGQIIPVNTRQPGENLVVAWYETHVTGVAWPSLAVSYLPEWPVVNPIVIANQLGSGALPAATYGNARIYNQPDVSAPGQNPNEEHAVFGVDGAGDPVVFAMRDDLNGILNRSEPYVLVKYQDVAEDWAFEIFKVCATEDEGLCATGAPGSGVFAPTVGGALDKYALEAGSLLQPPAPFTGWTICEESGIPEGPAFDPAQAGWEDFTGQLWARAANIDIGNTILRYYYPLQPGFFFDFDETEGPDLESGTCVPWLDRGTGTPVDVAYEFTWPLDTPVLSVGESLYTAKKGLPDIKDQLATQIVFDEATFNDIGFGPFTSTTKSLVRLFDPVSERKVSLALVSVPDVPKIRRNGRIYFSDLPFTLRSRLSYDEQNEQLIFGGSITEPISGDVQVLPNIMTSAERAKIKSLIAGQAFSEAVSSLYHATRNPNRIDLDGDNAAEEAYLVGLMAAEDGDSNGDGIPDRVEDGVPDSVDRQSLVNKPMILSAGKAIGEGYVTLAVNNHPDAAGSPIDLYVMRVDGCNAYQGNIWIVPSDNIFEESLTLRHTGDFGGDPDAFTFEWYYQPDAGLANVPLDVAGPPASPWLFHETGAGLVDITIEGAGVKTLSDNWFVTRYSGIQNRMCDGEPLPSTDVSDWAGAPGGDLAMLATGWIKRVIGGLNPFDSRVSNFHDNEASTITSMISQLGEPYVGPIPFNPDGDVINSIGLIEAYETILRRGEKLSIDAGINNFAVNNQLLNVATRIAEFYTLLGNEAYADAADSTIGFDTGSELGTLASSIFTFQNQLASPMEEELVLLRGRDDSQGSVRSGPVYNRLLWNFTQGNGEVAYVQSYNIVDRPGDDDGKATEEDAHFLYPQGHGDAWGHYLSSVKMRYDLLQEPNFTWKPRTESVLVAGNPIVVDYLDERKFATSAAAKARTGAEIVNLTYREHYVEDPNGQWQGYRDTDTDRAWGLDGWGRRAGQGAYFDWLTANAILPFEDPDATHEGINKVDRTTVPELSQIASSFRAIQGQVDRADAGLNPIGLAKGVVPFDIDPNFDTPGTTVQGQTHFEQIADRAQQALDNAVLVFNHANQQTQSLRNVQDDVDALTQSVVEQELEYKHRLIEIFGYPYPNDPDVPAGHDGPDLDKFMYIASDITSDLVEPDGTDSFIGYFSAIAIGPSDADPSKNAYSAFFPADFTSQDAAAAALLPEGTTRAVTYPVSTGADWPFIAMSSWGERRAPGEAQIALSDALQAQASLQLSVRAHENLLEELQDRLDLLNAEFFNHLKIAEILTDARDFTVGLNTGMGIARSAQVAARAASQIARDAAEIVEISIPLNAGTTVSVGSPAKGVAKLTGSTIANVSDVAAAVAEATELALELDKDRVAQQTEIDLFVDTNNIDLIERVKELEQIWRQESVLRLEMTVQAEVVRQAFARYYQVVAEGDRILEERFLFRLTTAGATQEHRYRDMTFRIFRNDALQKYRAQFELAARYIYLAATAYDYETNLLGGENGAGRDFLADIVRQRTVGQVVGGVPVAGTPGLADVLARLTQNFEVYKGQLGFNNPQTETNRFSLRRELFRIRDDSDEAWRETLENARVDNLWDVPEFTRLARAFAPESEGPQPGLVLRFPTTVTFGLNYFGHPLGGGDSAYDSTNFATKVRSVGTWFTNYDGNELSNTPRIYLLPVGMDVLRSPNNNTLSTREWRVVDQKLPVPFPIGASDLIDPDWIPANDSLSDTYADIRRFSSFRAYHDSGSFDEAETISDSRLIGRSVWNTEWMMIIPGGTLLYDPDEGLDQLVSGQLIPGGFGERDGNGISDIKLFFQTYGYSGN